MFLRRRSFLILVIAALLVSTTVRAQEAPTTEPPIPTAIPTETATLPSPPTDVPTFTPIPTDPPTPEPSFTPLPPPTETETLTPTASLTFTDTPSLEPSASPSLTATNTEEVGITVSPSLTATASQTATTTTTASLTASMTASATVEEMLSVQDVQALNVTCDPSANMSLASVNSDGVLGNATSGMDGIAISDTGRYIVFASSASNLVPNDTNNQSDIFSFDRETCQVIRISTALNGDQANSASIMGDISADGQIIAFHSDATNLIANNPYPSIYVRNFTTNTLIRVQNTSSTSQNLSLSDNGRFMTYTETSGTYASIMLVDLQTNFSSSIASSVSQPTVSKISGDSRKIVFFNNSSISLYDRIAHQTQTYVFAVNKAAGLDISSDGRYIVVGSDVTTLVPNDTNGYMDVYVMDNWLGSATRASVNTNGAEANNQSAFVSISADGRYVSFVSRATNLVSGDTNNASDVFIRDLLYSQTYLVSSVPNGVLGNADSGGFIAPISANNQYVAFPSNASNLAPGDTAAFTDVLVSYLPAYQANFNATATASVLTATATITPLPSLTFGAPVSILPCTPNAAMVIASVASSGTQGMQSSHNPSVSASGRYIAFESYAENLVSGDTNGVMDVFVFDRETCQTVRASVAANGIQANYQSQYAGISPSGRYVAFLSDASNLTSGDNNYLWDIYVKDLQTGAINRIETNYTESHDYRAPYFAGDDNVIYADFTSISAYNLSTQQSTVLLNQPSFSVSKNAVSSDLRYVVFSSGAANLVPNDTNNISDVFLLDRQTTQITRISVSSAGEQSTSTNGQGSGSASISANGRYVVFESRANNLVPGESGVYPNVFVRDLQTGITTQVSISNTGVFGNAASGFGSISDDGRYVAFLSSATNLAANDTNGVGGLDIFVRDLVMNQTYLISRNVDNVSSTALYDENLDPMISRDGEFITFTSGAVDLVANDANYANDIFVARRADFVANDNATATAAVPMTQTAVAPSTATAAAQMTQTAVAQATSTAAAANTIVVNTAQTIGGGSCNISTCTLVQAVELSNSMNSMQTIVFNIPGTGVHRITLNETLYITSSVIIDGASQPGYAGSPLIEIVPQAGTGPADAIVVNGATPITYDPTTSVTIRGLAIGKFLGSAIALNNGQQHVIEDNYIGTIASGMVALSNATGIMMRSPNNIIRNNLISGNDVGLYLYSNAGRNSTNNSIVGNFIGTDVTGTTDIPNGIGIRLTEGASNNVIGGVGDEGNVISGNESSGILLDSLNTSGNVIAGNYIGLDSTGGFLLGNGGAGIQLSGATNTVIGGAAADLGNEIWGNNTGIATYNQSANTLIQLNVIAQNGSVGLFIGDSDTTILENIIAFHTNVGIEIGAGTRNLISRNHIFSNNGLGIDLGGYYSVLPNDPLDADTGANGLQNYPVISAVNNSISGSTITGSLSSKPNSTYRVEFFSNNVCDTSGYGEGQFYIGYTDVTTNASGIANFSAQMPQILENAVFGTGWSGVFYPSNNLTGTGVPVSGVDGLNFNWGSGSPVVNGIVVAGIPSDNFSARFTSTQSFAAGTYNFVANSDDGVRVYIDGVLRLDKFTGRPLTSDQFTATLTAGNHTLTVEYFDGMDQAALQFSWYLNGTVSKVITSTATDSSGNTSGFSACRPFQTILGLGSYQETNLAFAYQGNWMSLNGAGNGGSFKYTNAANASMSFWVNSTVSRVTFYRTVHPSYGSTQIFLDGSATPFATINNVSPTVAYGVPFTLTLPAGGHRIELRNVGTAYSSIDQIDLLPAAAPLTTTPGVYQDTDPNLTFTGTWVHNPMVGTLGGSRRYTNDPTARLSFKIDSSVGRVVIYRTVYQTGVYGLMQAYVDGVLVATIPNNPSATFQYGVPFAFEVTPGNHTIEIRNVGSTFSDLDQITLLAPATALTLGTVQESADGLTYSGKWTDIADGAALSGARRYTNDPNARVNFKVDSSVGRITIYRTIAGSTFGSLQVYVDGVLNSTIANNTASTVQYGVPFTFAVTPGSHTIELRNVGSKFSDLDQITLAEPAAPLTIGTYQENHADLNYVGNWITVTNSGLGGGRSYTNDPNARVNFKVDSSVGRVTIYRTIAGSTFGSLQVYVDGVLNTTIANNTSSTVQYGVPFTFAITPGSHTIELRNVGSTFSDLDQIILAEPAAPLAVGTYQETQPEITYTGNWITVTNSGLGGGRSYTNDPNARATFNIDDSVGSITLYRTIAGSTFGTMQVYVDGVLHSTIANNTSSMVQYGVPYTLTLFPGSHTIELRNVDSKFSDLDQIILAEPTALLTAGTYQETDAELTFMGNWTTVTNSGLGGGRSYTNDPNARVSFYVDGTIGRVTIYRTVAGSTFGTMQVYIDGVLHSTIANNTSSTVQYGVPYTFAVSLGAHHIELRNVGSKFSDLDQIILEEPLPPLSTTPGTYQESDPTLIYFGNWTTISNSSALGGSRRYTNEVNARVSFPIDADVGRVIVYRTIAGSTFGSLQIYVDGVLSGTIANNTSTTVQYGVPYTFNVTPAGHWIELRNVGGTFSDIDQIKLIEPAQSLNTSYSLYQDDAFDLSYSGNWQPAYNIQALGGSRTLTNDPNARVSFTIDSSVGPVTIYRSVFSNIYGSLQVYLDGMLIGTIMNNTSSTFQYGVPYTFTVIPGNHTVDLRNVGATYSDIDQIVVTAS